MADGHPPHAAPEPPDGPEVRHETSDVNIRGILLFAAGLIVAALFINVGVWLLFELFSARAARRAAPEYPLAATERMRVPPEPRLQPFPPEWRTPREDLAALRAKDRELLATYGWVDENGGVVRIPIDEAMKLVVLRGLPARETGNK